MGQSEEQQQWRRLPMAEQSAQSSICVLSSFSISACAILAGCHCRDGLWGGEPNGVQRPWRCILISESVERPIEPIDRARCVPACACCPCLDLLHPLCAVLSCCALLGEGSPGLVLRVVRLGPFISDRLPTALAHRPWPRLPVRPTARLTLRPCRAGRAPLPHRRRRRAGGRGSSCSGRLRRQRHEPDEPGQ